MGLKVGGTNIPLPPPPPPKSKKRGGGAHIVLSRLLDTRDRVVPIVFTKIDEIAEIKRRYDVISLFAFGALTVGLLFYLLHKLLCIFAIVLNVNPCLFLFFGILGSSQQRGFVFI